VEVGVIFDLHKGVYQRRRTTTWLGVARRIAERRPNDGAPGRRFV